MELQVTKEMEEMENLTSVDFTHTCFMNIPYTLTDYERSLSCFKQFLKNQKLVEQQAYRIESLINLCYSMKCIYIKTEFELDESIINFLSSKMYLVRTKHDDYESEFYRYVISWDNNLHRTFDDNVEFFQV